MQGFLALNLFLMVCIEAFISAQSVAELKWQNGVTQGSYASGKCQGNFIFFKVREFYVVSGKNECFLKCQGIVREFYNIHFLSNDEKKPRLGHFF